MFIFERSWQAVAAGLAVALLIVCLDRLCQPPSAAGDDGRAANAPCAACAVHIPCGIVRAGS
jgi:hypothetical protein